MASAFETSRIKQSAVCWLRDADCLRCSRLDLSHPEIDAFVAQKWRRLKNIDRIVFLIAEINTDLHGHISYCIPVLMGVNRLTTHDQGIKIVDKFLFGS